MSERSTQLVSRVRSVVSDNDIKKVPNPYVRQFSIHDLLRKCFMSEVLPTRETHPTHFQDKEIFAGLYTSDRKWEDEIEWGVGQPDRHERYLDYLFWKEDESDTSQWRRWLCITGEVGCGKTTLIDYYLRCHCPKTRPEAFKKKLVLFCDLKDIQDPRSFRAQFYNSIQKSIVMACRQMDVEIRKGRQHTKDLEQWVKESLEILTEIARDGSDPPFQYIILVLDNLEQTTPSVQVKAITEVHSWDVYNFVIRLTRVFVPMWPSTYESLRQTENNLFRGVQCFQVGPLGDPESVVRKRYAAMEQYLRQTEDAGGEDFTRFVETIIYISRRPLITMYPPEAESATSPAASKCVNFFDLVRRLTNGDMRRELTLWESIISGSAAYYVWGRGELSASRSYEYELLDAMVVGAKECLAQSDFRIANVFRLGHDVQMPRDLLVGVHILHHLSQISTETNSQVSIEDLKSHFVSDLGYSENNLLHALKQLLKFNVVHAIHEVNITNETDTIVQYDIHKPVVDAYQQLALEPAYIDNVAMVTPVREDLLKRMTKTHASHTFFADRIETTVAFIEYIREIEDAFCSTVRLSKDTDATTFERRLEVLRIPFMWKRMARRYHERLTHIRRSQGQPNVDHDWWNRILKYQIFQDCRSDSTSSYLRATP